MSGKVYRRHHRHHQHSLRCVFCVILILLLLAFVELGFEHHNITGVCTCKMYHRRTIENECYVLTIAFQLHMRTWPVSGAMSNAHYQRILLVKVKWIWPMDWFTFSHAQASSSSESISNARVRGREVTMKARRSRSHSQFLSFLH